MTTGDFPVYRADGWYTTDGGLSWQKPTKDVERWNIDGGEPYRFHPGASHGGPDYRDGWNAALDAVAFAETQRSGEVAESALTVGQLLSALGRSMTIAGYNGSCERVVNLDRLMEELKGLIAPVTK